MKFFWQETLAKVSTPGSREYGERKASRSAVFLGLTQKARHGTGLFVWISGASLVKMIINTQVDYEMRVTVNSLQNIKGGTLIPVDLSQYSNLCRM